MKINQIEPWIDEEERFWLNKVVDSTYVTEGKLTEQFEHTIKEYTNAKYVQAYTNGTMALYALLLAYGIGPGDEVIVPDITFVATANAVIMAGATPVFCEIEPDYFCIDPTQISKYINSKTKCIIPVHLYGQSCNMKEIMNIATSHNLLVIEDAAQGMGVRHNNKHVGTIGHAGILSFYGNKTITCGEGGIILTENEEIHKKCYRLKNHGRSVKGVFYHEEIGYNFSFTEMQAAIGLAQLGKLDRIIDKKKKINNRYISELQNISQLSFVKIRKESTPVFWFTSILSNKSQQLRQYLSENDIGSRLFFYPLHSQPCYNKSNSISTGNYEYSMHIYNKALSLPSSYNMTDEMQAIVIEKIQEFYDRID